MFHQQVFTNFAQQHEEPFYAAWERFNDLADWFRYHDFSNYSLIQFFYNGLDVVTRRWVINGALATGSPLFSRDDDGVMHLLNDMADFDYHRYWNPSLQDWSHQYLPESHYPDFTDQPFEHQKEEGDSFELGAQLESTVNKFVALTEMVIENQMNSRRQLDEQIATFIISNFEDRQENEVKHDTQTVIHQVWFDDDDDDDDSTNQEWESDSNKAEDLEMFEPSPIFKPQSEEVLKELSFRKLPSMKLENEYVDKIIDWSSSNVPSYSPPENPFFPSMPTSPYYILYDQKPNLEFPSHGSHSKSSVVEVTSLICSYLAKLEGTWNHNPYVVSYDTSYGRQPLFDELF